MKKKLLKKRLLNFAGFILSILIICITVVVYVELQNINAREWQSKAIIAQAQSAIIEAQTQLVVNKAVAFQLYTNSILLVVLAMSPFVLLIILLTVILCKWIDNEKLQKCQRRTTD